MQQQQPKGDHSRTTSQHLQGWIWPPILEDDLSKLFQYASQEQQPTKEYPTHKAFNYMVTEPNNRDVQIFFLNRIENSWKESKHGIILGGEEFDRITSTPDTHYDATTVIKHIIQKLNILPHQVTIVLNYRTPRVEQWISSYKQMKKVGATVHYYHYVCTEDHYDFLIELLDNGLNPLRLAYEFRHKHNWNVKLFDMGGVQESKTDIAHAIACKVLVEPFNNDGCRYSWLSDLYNTTYHSNEIETELQIPKEKTDELELLFRERDCYYQNVLQNDDGFKVLYADTLWNGCSNDDVDLKELYKQLTDSDYFLQALKVNRRCGSKSDEDEVDIGSIIGNHKIDEMTSHNIIVNGTYDDMIFIEGRMAGENAPFLTFIVLAVAMIVGLSHFALKKQQSSMNNDHNADDDEFLDMTPSAATSREQELTIIT
jgi:hypothetical protein